MKRWGVTTSGSWPKLSTWRTRAWWPAHSGSTTSPNWWTLCMMLGSFTDLCTIALIIVLTDCYCTEHQVKHELSLLWQIVKKVNLFCLSTFIQAESMKVEFPEMMSEVISSQLPKVLAGMVRPLLFHTKWQYQHRYHNSAEISCDWITDFSTTGRFVMFAFAVTLHEIVSKLNEYVAKNL